MIVLVHGSQNTHTHTRRHKIQRTDWWLSEVVMRGGQGIGEMSEGNQKVETSS